MICEKKVIGFSGIRDPENESGGTSVKDVYNLLDSIFPYATQEDYDNSGIMIDFGREISKIIVCLDITNDIVETARKNGAQLIVSHHPVIFHPVKSIRFNSPLQNLAAAQISAISVHTNLDICEGGVNDNLAKRLDLQNIRPVFQVFEKRINGVMKENFIGRMGELDEEMTPAAFASFVGKQLLGRSAMEYVDGGNPIRRVAVGGGSCGEFIEGCEKHQIDAFVTGEAKHHQLLYAKEKGITMIVAGHYATECVVLDTLVNALSNAFADITIRKEIVDNPNSFTD